MKNLKQAIREWTVILTPKRISIIASVVEKEATATFKTTQTIQAILKPINRAEVSALLKIATKNNIPVYPVSGGKNWGLGSKVPQKDGVLIDLSHMKKITRFNEMMAYMTVEPGVTFLAATEFLKKRKSSLMLDTIGSTPHASIIGNTAERGHGMAFYADRFNFVCGMEVVLPTGEIIETGFENFQDSKLGPLAKWGVGPYLDGLFTQSNLGIITKLTVWLRAKPVFFQSFIFQVNDEDKLSTILDQWRQMGFDGFHASMRIFNDLRMISFTTRFPQTEKTPLSDKKLGEMRSSRGLGKWIGIGGLYAPSLHHAQADKAFIKERIESLVDNLTFYDQAVIDKTYTTADEATRNQLDFMFNKSLLRGNTSVAGFNMVYWRKPPSVPIGDIHLDRCGVLWYCLSIPFTGKDAQAAIAVCRDVCKKHGFELNIGFLFVSERTLDITGAICYDRDIENEDEKAMQCHNLLIEKLVKKGYSPYRLGIQSMQFVERKDAGARAVSKKIKQALDPKGILAPGHYIE